MSVVNLFSLEHSKHLKLDDFEGVTGVSPGCLKFVSRVSEGCFKCVPRW